MADYNPVDPQSGWEYDLHSVVEVYTAYIGYFQIHGIQWWNHSWGSFFATFDQFLQFGWPAIVVTDVYPPYNAHIVTTHKNISAFLKMIRTRFGEHLEVVPNITRIRPAETRPRPMRHINDIQFYKKIHATLPAATLSAQKERVRMGDPTTIEELWKRKDKNFLAIDFEWSEKNSSTCLEFGYAALRSRHVAASGAWPPVPENNFRMGHFVISEYLDVIVNRRFPTFPRAYAFGTTQTVLKRQLGTIIQAIVDSLSSPESETQSNDLILVAHGVSGDLERLSELKIKLPSNTFILDTTSFERQLFRVGRRPPMIDPTTGLARQAGSTLSLSNLLISLGIDTSTIVFHNSGNDAFSALLSLVLLLEPETRLKSLRRIPGSGGLTLSASHSQMSLRPGLGSSPGPRQNSDLDVRQRKINSTSATIPPGHDGAGEHTASRSGVAIIRTSEDTSTTGSSLSEEEEDEEEDEPERGPQNRGIRAPGRAPGRDPRPGRWGGAKRENDIADRMKGMNI